MSTKTPVPAIAVIRRARRSLRKAGLSLVKATSQDEKALYGAWYTREWPAGAIEGTHLSIAEIVAEEGVLRTRESCPELGIE